MSAIKTILMHMDDSPACTVRLEVANALAERFDATATALYAVMPAFMQYALAFSAGAEMAPLMREYEMQRRASARACFDSVVGSVAAKRLPHIEWAETVGEPSALFALQALGADLLLLGQHDPGSAATERDVRAGVSADFAESVLLASGKPAPAAADDLQARADRPGRAGGVEGHARIGTCAERRAAVPAECRARDSGALGRPGGRRRRRRGPRHRARVCAGTA